MEDKTQSLDRWRLDLKRLGKMHWTRFYSEFLDQEVSNRARFFRALNLYGDWALFEAIIDTSSRELEGDKLPYVLKVTHNKWKEAQQQTDADTDYALAIEKSKEASARALKELERRLQRRKKKK